MCVCVCVCVSLFGLMLRAAGGELRHTRSPGAARRSTPPLTLPRPFARATVRCATTALSRRLAGARCPHACKAQRAEPAALTRRGEGRRRGWRAAKAAAQRRGCSPSRPERPGLISAYADVRRPGGRQELLEPSCELRVEGGREVDLRAARARGRSRARAEARPSGAGGGSATARGGAAWRRERRQMGGGRGGRWAEGEEADGRRERRQMGGGRGGRWEEGGGRQRGGRGVDREGDDQVSGNLVYSCHIREYIPFFEQEYKRIREKNIDNTWRENVERPTT